jgi:hypothetical protein
VVPELILLLSTVLLEVAFLLVGALLPHHVLLLFLTCCPVGDNDVAVGRRAVAGRAIA